MIFAKLKTVGIGCAAMAALVAWGADAPAPAANQPSRPNIVLILADDMGYGDPSVDGGWIKMPSLERLAKGGMRFLDFHSNGAVCSPTRAALLTGRYQQRAGIEDVLVENRRFFSYGMGLDPQSPTFASILHQAGYKTAIFGKWHLGERIQYNPLNYGFDEFRGYLAGAMDYVAHQRDWWIGKKQEDEPGYTTDTITRHAVDYHKAHKNDTFCLYVPYQAVHLPWQAPGDGRFTKPYREWTRPQIAEKYELMAKEMDLGIGEILDTMQSCGLTEKTLVFFFSDNGGVGSIPACNKPYRGYKAQLFEGGHRVTAMAYWPSKIPAGTVTSELAAGMDLLPTFADIAGVPLPAGRKFDGVSLKNLLLHQQPLPHRQMFWGYEARGTAMRDGHWKYLTLTRGGEMLYDLAQDPAEATNLAKEFPEQTQKMRLAVTNWLADVHAEFPLKAWKQ